MQETERLHFYIGTPSSGWDVEILKTYRSSDFVKTNRSPKVDVVFASIWGLLGAMFPKFFEYSSDEIYSDELKMVSETAPKFVKAWKAQKVIAAAWKAFKARKVAKAVRNKKVGGKTLRRSKRIGSSGVMRRLRK
jgi:hypothetical protein